MLKPQKLSYLRVLVEKTFGSRCYVLPFTTSSIRHQGLTGQYVYDRRRSKGGVLANIAGRWMLQLLMHRANLGLMMFY